MKLIVACITFLIGTALIDKYFLHGAHHGAFWQEWPAGYALFGFIVCLALIKGAKSLGLAILRETDDD